jgi:Lon protease-like protein
MFPLGTVLFPHALLPLHIFEPRYRVMMRHCLDADREFGVVLIERGSEVGGGDVRFDIGTTARIVQANELADGRWVLSTVGLRRLQVVRWLPDDPYPQAEVDELAEPTASEDSRAAADAAATAFEEVFALWHRLDERVPVAPVPRSDDAGRDVFELAAAAPLGPLDAQRILEAPTPTVRAELLRDRLADLGEELRARLALE